MSLLARVCWHGGFGCTIGQSWRQIGQAFSQRGSWRESRTQTMTLMERPASGATYGPACTRPSAARGHSVDEVCPGARREAKCKQTSG